MVPMRRLKNMRVSYLVLLSLLAMISFAVQAQETSIADKQNASMQASQLSVKASGIKQSVLELNRDLYQLEEELLSPATTRAAVYFSLSYGEFFEPYSINITVDDKQPIQYLYTKRQVSALRQGAVQPLKNLNLGPGVHTIKAIAKGVDNNGKNRELVLEERVEKHDQPLYIELKIQDNKEIQSAELLISQW
ncbi:MAG: cell division protein FtsB [Oleispira sp.]|jgi:cell division protein FtsB